MTRWAGGLNDKEALALLHGPSAAARWAGLWFTVVLTAAAIAFVADFVAAQVDGFFAASGGFDEVELEGDFEAGASGWAALATATTAEKLIENRTAATAATKDVTEGREYIFHRGEALTGVAHAVDTSMAVLVVALTLFIIAKYFVGFSRFFELSFGFGIIRVAVRMEFHRQFAVGFFNFISACRFIDAEYLVIISFAHAVHPTYSA